MKSIFELSEQSSIAKVFRGSSFYLLGSKKSGKTSTALGFHKFNESPFKHERKGRTLLIALESGYKAISTPFTPVVVNSFNQFKQVITELEKDAKLVAEGKKNDTEFELIVIDSLDILATYIMDFINSKYGVSNIADTPAKCGYREIQTIMEAQLTRLTKLSSPEGQLLYTTCWIGHSDTKEIKCPVTRQRLQVVVPACEKRVSSTVSKHCDNTILLTVAENETTGQEERYAVVRSANVQEIGSRYPLMPNIIPMGNDGATAIHDALMKAIEDQAAQDGLDVTNVNKSILGEDVVYNFNELMEQAKAVYDVFEQAGKAASFVATVEQCLGTGRRISDCTELQVEALADTVQTLKDKAKALGIA